METANLTPRSDIAAQLALVQECRAIQPNIDLQLAPSNVAGLVFAVNKPLRVLAVAGNTLAYDVHTFITNGLVEKEGTTTIRFVRAAYYYGNSLILAPFNQIQDMVAGIVDTRPTLKKREAIERARWTLSIPSLADADLVPSASPYQLLFEALLGREDTAEKLRSYDDQTLLLSLREMQLLALSPNPSTLEPRPNKIGDGRPAMVFASVYHEKNGAKCVLFGCNSPDWSGLPAVSAITKTMRNHRLQAYIPWGNAAFQALRKVEQSFWPDSDSSGGGGGGDNSDETKRRRREARKRARAVMREHDAFFGGTHEHGIALQTPEWSSHMPCYLCAGMMRYKEVDDWSEDARGKYCDTFR
ncbi:hypothetical protein C8A01DRAFT_40262 [Parachaetomium inaequale]|uniref:Uncharacterized protein n=1 Tax=Parachaetomium inaequale TaxID=2588326 RepID=A0AAN6P7P5_9PEZI|nr:hypothetical protein C8A01DRAFT_40262 [Parachaetomium inaequale]